MLLQDSEITYKLRKADLFVLEFLELMLRDNATVEPFLAE